jgi:hypothetical protein
MLSSVGFSPWVRIRGSADPPCGKDAVSRGRLAHPEHRRLLLAGEAPGSAEIEPRAVPNDDLCVDATAETYKRVDRGKDEHDRQFMLPERNADERAAGGQDERRGQREDGEDVRERAAGVDGKGDVADEESAENERPSSALTGPNRLRMSDKVSITTSRSARS